MYGDEIFMKNYLGGMKMPKIISIIEAFQGLIKNKHVDVIQFPNKGTGSVFGCVADLGQEIKLIRAFNNEEVANYSLAEIQATNEQTIERLKSTYSFRVDEIIESGPLGQVLQEEWFEAGDILYICSTELMTKSMQASYEKAISIAWRKHCPIVFNVLLNGATSDQMNENQALLKRYIDISDIIIVNETDLPPLTGINNEQEAIKSLLRQVPTVVYTKSMHGSRVYTRAYQVSHSGMFVPKEEKAKAHDVFVGAFLTQLLMHQVHGEIAIDKLKMYEILHYSTSQSYFIELGSEKNQDYEVYTKKNQAM
ncbi:MAG TPA: hypothetical protein DCY20_09610 [Firmicutes bacterium]|nr:hypothetical protein [Bacillota bacterium]